MARDNTSLPTETISSSESEEGRVFFFLAVMLTPILSIVLVGGNGFLIWMAQLFFGPPSH